MQKTRPSSTAPSLWKRLFRVCAKATSGKEPQLKQNNPHPDPLPSDGRGNSLIGRLQFPKRLDPHPDGGRFSLSHPMGEGRGEGEPTSKSEIVFARVLNSTRVSLHLSVQSALGSDNLAR